MAAGLGAVPSGLPAGLAAACCVVGPSGALGLALSAGAPGLRRWPAPRSMKMGTIASPWRYDVAAQSCANARAGPLGPAPFTTLVIFLADLTGYEALFVPESLRLWIKS
jgi:hypothetical protein